MPHCLANCYSFSDRPAPALAAGPGRPPALGSGGAGVALVEAGRRADLAALEGDLQAVGAAARHLAPAHQLTRDRAQLLAEAPVEGDGVRPPVRDVGYDP